MDLSNLNPNVFCIVIVFCIVFLLGFRLRLLQPKSNRPVRPITDNSLCSKLRIQYPLEDNQFRRFGGDFRSSPTNGPV
ncbi:MAG: hypothetical protein DWI26_07470, partial [Planctomycetota bacterium]